MKDITSKWTKIFNPQGKIKMIAFSFFDTNSIIEVLIKGVVIVPLPNMDWYKYGPVACHCSEHQTLRRRWHLWGGCQDEASLDTSPPLCQAYWELVKTNTRTTLNIWQIQINAYTSSSENSQIKRWGSTSGQVTLTGSLPGGFGVEDRQRVVGVQVRLKERHRHGPHQGRQALPQCRKMPAGQHVNSFSLYLTLSITWHQDSFRPDSQGHLLQLNQLSKWETIFTTSRVTGSKGIMTQNYGFKE